MPESTNLTRADSALRLPGKVNFQTVSRLYEDFQCEFDDTIDRLDCRDVDVADSSAVSLLLACTNLAKRRDRELHITGMNDQLNSLALLYGVETLLKSE